MFFFIYLVGMNIVYHCHMYKTANSLHNATVNKNIQNVSVMIAIDE